MPRSRAASRRRTSARGATAYVTLEPCSHTGSTRRARMRLVAAGIARVVAATGDPDPRVSGKRFHETAGPRASRSNQD